MTGLDVIEELDGYEIKFGKEVKDNPELPGNRKKRSIFLSWNTGKIICYATI